MAFSERELRIDMIVQAYVKGKPEVLQALGEMSDKGDTFRDRILASNQSLQAMDVTQKEVAASATRLGQTQGEASQATDKQRGFVEQLGFEYRKLIRNLTVVFVAYQMLRKAYQAADEAVKKVVESGKYLTTAYDTQIERGEKIAEQVGAKLLPLWTQLKTLLNDVTEAVFELTDAELALIEAQQAGLVTDNDMVMANTGQRVTLGYLRQEVDAGRFSYERYREILRLVADGSIEVTEASPAEALILGKNATIDFADALAQSLIPELEEVRKKTKAANDEFALMKQRLDFSMKFTAQTGDAIGKIEELMAKQAELEGSLTDMGVEGFVSNEQFQQVEDLRTAYLNAAIAYDQWQDALDKGDLKPREIAEAKTEMEELEDVMGNAWQAAKKMGLTPLWTEQQQEDVDQAQTELGETKAKIEEVIAAYDKSTKEMVINTLMQAATQKMANDDTQMEGLALLGLAGQLATEWGLSSADAITFFEDIQSGISNTEAAVKAFAENGGTDIAVFLESEEAQSLMQYFIDLQALSTVRIRVETGGFTGGGSIGGGQMGEPGDPYPTARGGWLRPFAEVGEQGSEGVVEVAPGMFWVIPHEEWSQMKQGRSVRGFASGGMLSSMGGGDGLRVAPGGMSQGSGRGDIYIMAPLTVRTEGETDLYTILEKLGH